MLEASHGLERGVGSQAVGGAGADFDRDGVLEGGGINQQDQLHQGILTPAGRVALASAAGGELPTENN